MKIEKIRSLFEGYNIVDVIEKFRYYIHALIANHMFLRKDLDDTFAGYRQAWRYAKQLRAYLPGDVNGELVECLAREIDGLAAKEYIRNITPQLFVGDVSQFFAYFEAQRAGKVYDDPTGCRVLLYDLLKIYAVLMATAAMGRLTAEAKQVKPQNLPEVLFASFLQWKKGNPAYDKIVGLQTEQQVYEIWMHLYGILLDSPVIKNKAAHINLLRELQQVKCPEETILQCYSIAQTGKLFHLKEIVSAPAYFHTVYAGEKSTKAEADSPGCNYYWRCRNGQNHIDSCAASSVAG